MSGARTQVLKNEVLEKSSTRFPAPLKSLKKLGFPRFSPDTESPLSGFLLHDHETRCDSVRPTDLEVFEYGTEFKNASAISYSSPGIDSIENSISNISNLHNHSAIATPNVLPHIRYKHLPQQCVDA